VSAAFNRRRVQLCDKASSHVFHAPSCRTYHHQPSCSDYTRQTFARPMSGLLGSLGRDATPQSTLALAPTLRLPVLYCSGAERLKLWTTRVPELTIPSG
jgi:hypothetical protein